MWLDVYVSVYNAKSWTTSLYALNRRWFGKEMPSMSIHVSRVQKSVKKSI